MPDIHVAPDQNDPDAWRVEDTDADGEGACAVTIFAGYQAERRAREYADWLEGTADMSDDEIALRAAINVLRDSIEAGKMPSGLALAGDARAVHENAADRLEELLRRDLPRRRPGA